MRFVLDENEQLDSEWLNGLCHIHALAAVEHHGGGFVLVTDNDGMDPRDVLHVLSVHDAPGGPVIRDAAGEAREADLFDYVDRLFPGRFGERVDLDLAGLRHMLATGRLRADPMALAAAREMGTVQAPPGALLAMDDEPEGP